MVEKKCIKMVTVRGIFMTSVIVTETLRLYYIKKLCLTGNTRWIHILWNSFVCFL